MDKRASYSNMVMSSQRFAKDVMEATEGFLKNAIAELSLEEYLHFCEDMKACYSKRKYLRKCEV